MLDSIMDTSDVLLLLLLCIFKFRERPHALTTPSTWGPVEVITAAACSLEATCYAIRPEIAIDDTLAKRDIHSEKG